MTFIRTANTEEQRESTCSSNVGVRRLRRSVTATNSRRDGRRVCWEGLANAARMENLRLWRTVFARTGILIEINLNQHAMERRHIHFIPHTMGGGVA